MNAPHIVYWEETDSGTVVRCDCGWLAEGNGLPMLNDLARDHVERSLYATQRHNH